MHEIQLMRQVVRQIEKVALDQTHGYPVRVRLQIREHSHLAEHTTEELQQTFQMAANGTCAHTAGLEIIMMPTEGVCRTCREQVRWTGDLVTCPSCRTGQIDWKDSPEVFITEVEWCDDSA